ncbi:MAG: enterotoxin [Rudaea sp.]|uniref:enterotoxin n=1 Tax=Rudaea sp. TaxID=2136325 RepID=UPI0039E3970A
MSSSSNFVFPHRASRRKAALCAIACTLAGATATVVHAASGDDVRTERTTATVDKDGARLGTATIAATWKLSDGHFADFRIGGSDGAPAIKVVEPFALAFADGTRINASDLHATGAARTEKLAAAAKASRLAERIPGRAIAIDFTDKDDRFRFAWQLQQREGSAYLRELLTITALKQDEAIAEVELLKLDDVMGARVAGDVNGSPIVFGNYYVGFENPLSESQARWTHARTWIKRSLPLRRGQSIGYSAVVGVARDGQLRRDFAAYLERERAHPYRPFLHYNSWYDIGYFTPYTQEQALDRIHAFGEELSVKRHVKLDSFLFDDGWDDRSGSWHFSKDFPQGFVPLKDAAAKYGAAPGVWLSPWGGYSKPKEERVRNGRAAGYEIIDNGLALSGPKYYQRFHDAVLELLTKNGINQFKFDGTGNADKVFPGSRFDSDFAAAIALIDDIRAAKPDTFVNLTTGTYPSPFWLRYADSIWRGGEDDDFAGVGTHRERWITYRDADTYRNIVEKGPLYPLNSLMLHGIIYAQMHKALNTDPGHDFANEVHSYFASGTQLQELYITPKLLSDSDWDTLAEAARWSRDNAMVLRDTHWIGGDPGRLDVYGWAAWTPQKAFVTLRNPDAKAQLAVIDLQRQLELPPGSARRYAAKPVWGDGEATTFDADHAATLTLAPFQVVTFELTAESTR